MKRNILYKIALGIICSCIFVAIWFVYSEVYRAEAQYVEEITFTVNKGETARRLAERLESEQIVRHDWLFRRYLLLKGIDKKIHAGEFSLVRPITMARVASILEQEANKKEREVTILPGWDLHDIADYMAKIEIIEEDEFYKLVGRPAEKNSGAEIVLLLENEILNEKPKNLSIEGYLAPETFRIFEDENITSILERFITHREKQITDEMLSDIASSGRTLHEVLTMASIVEREVRAPKDRAKVADLFWRRYEKNWALQADSTVHYLSGKKGNVFTTKEDRDSLNEWNTYKYPGLPPGPISSPSISSIKATIYPEPNDNWYFLTTLEGEVKYAEDLDGHNSNVQKYLR